jgi:hypothetical protein
VLISSLIIHPIESLRPPSFCPGFYNQLDLNGLCSGFGIYSSGIRGATTLYVIMQDIDGIGGDHTTITDCRDAQNLAISDPESASNNAENYIVRIITRVSW